MRKTLIRNRIGEAQLPRAERLVLEPQLTVGGVVAVLAVAQNRAADVRQMRADLVGAPRDQLDLQFRQPPADRQRFVPGNDFLCAARRAVGNVDDPALGVLKR